MYRAKVTFIPCRIGGKKFEVEATVFNRDGMIEWQNIDKLCPMQTAHQAACNFGEDIGLPVMNIIQHKAKEGPDYIDIILGTGSRYMVYAELIN